MINESYVSEVKEKVSISDVASKFGMKIKNSTSGKFLCLCPFHDDHTPSMYLYSGTNSFYCFTCGAGGDVIKFVRDYKNLSFEEAVLYLLEEHLGISREKVKKEYEPRDIEAYRKRESFYAYMEIAHDFYKEQYLVDTKEAKVCREYAEQRLDRDFLLTFGVGYAPRSGHAFYDYAIKKGLRQDLLMEFGLISEKDGRLYDTFRGRLMIPQMEYGRVVTFTARDVTGKCEKKFKYINGKNVKIGDYEVYKKSHCIFGIDTAMPHIKKLNKAYLVEGAVDVMQLHSLGVMNVIAPLGGKWHESQFSRLKDLNVTLCFVPDNDKPKEGEKFGPGFNFVFRDAPKALSCGFNVSVREIPCEGEDAASYFRTLGLWKNIEEKSFIEWYADKIYDEEGSQLERQEQVDKICDALSLVSNKTLKKMLLDELKKKYKQARLWNTASQVADVRMLENKKNLSRSSSGDTCEFGFYESKDCYYYVFDDNGNEKKITNYLVNAYYLIYGENKSSRIFEIMNKKESVTIELSQSHVTNLKDFEVEIERCGDFVFTGSSEQFKQLRAYMYSKMEKAIPIVQVGWNVSKNGGFYAFANGVVHKGKWYQSDDFGIIKIDKEKLYIPVMSKMHRNNETIWSGKRTFVHDPLAAVTRKDYFSQIIKCFGDNGKICICYYLATIFRDIIKNTTRSFPILNVFGKKGTGKTTLAMCFTSLFQHDGDLTLLGSTTLFALSEKLSEFSNAVVHLDEYKNTLSEWIIATLKGTYDDSGRDKKSDSTGERVKIRTKCGIILTGQDMPTLDIALFERLIFLEAFKSVRSKEETEAMNELEEMRKAFPTNITVELLSYRDSFSNVWLSSWHEAQRRVKGLSDNIPERIINNWSIIYAVSLSFEKIGVSFPFNSDEILSIINNGICNQTHKSNNNDELANFWSLFDRARQVGDIIEKQHFKIARNKTSIILSEGRKTKTVKFDKPKDILFVRAGICIALANQQAKREGISEYLLSTESLLSYLTAAENEEYIGKNNANINFTVFDKNLNPLRRQVLDSYGHSKGWEMVAEKERPLAFDYELVKKHYDLDLERAYHVVPIDATEIQDENTDVVKEKIEEPALPF